MILPDVNVLVHAFREDSPGHLLVHEWFDEVLQSGAAFAVSPLVVSGFLRVVTHPRIFDPPTPLDVALEFVDGLLAQPGCVLVQPGPRHWAIFRRLIETSQAKGNHIADAWHAALAMESGCEWVSTDRDFSRFEGLRWRAPK